MRVLIAGCGYIGLPIATALCRAGHQVCGLRRSGAAAEELAAAGITPLTGDLTDLPSLERLPDDYDWVVNCAASAGGAAGDYRRLYVQGNANLINWLSGRPPRRFVYTSSTGVYGQDDGSEVNETSPTEPQSGTGQVLVEAEARLREAHARSGWPAVILRLAGIYGPGRGYLLKQFLSGQARLEGDGRRTLNMIHRDDVVSAVLCALEQGQAGETFNVVDDEPVTQRELFDWLAATLNQPVSPAVHSDATGRRRATNKRVSNGKLKRDLCWCPGYPTFREGFRALLAGG